MTAASPAPSAPAHALAYLARDVVNAPQIKARIQARSAHRGDSPEIAAWLVNHFYRYVVGNLQASPPAVQGLKQQDELQRLLGDASPAWALQRLPAVAPPDQAQAGLWWVDPDSRAVLQLEARLCEFLGSRTGTSLEGKLQRINAPQALARWTLEHLAFKQRQTSGHYDHQPSAVQAVLRTPNGVFVEFLGDAPALRTEMAFESQEMGHCVGQFGDRKHLNGGYGEHYASACQKGQMRLFSFRTGKGQPRITINAFVQSDGRLRIEQIKGKQNRPPIARYQGDVLQLLNHLPLDEELPDDAQAMGLVRLPTALLTPRTLQQPWQAVADVEEENQQLWLMQHHPELMPQLRTLHPLAQWMALARQDSLSAKALEKIPLSPALHDTLALARQRQRSAGATGAGSHAGGKP